MMPIRVYPKIVITLMFKLPGSPVNRSRFITCIFLYFVVLKSDFVSALTISLSPGTLTSMI